MAGNRPLNPAREIVRARDERAFANPVNVCNGSKADITVPKPDPDYYHSLSREQKDHFNIETGKKIIALERMQKIEPTCYEPMGWLGKRTLSLEKWLGTAK
jgi:hypothetical protein